MKPDKYVLPPKTKSLEVRGTGRWEEKYVHTGRGTEEDGWCPLDTWWALYQLCLPISTCIVCGPKDCLSITYIYHCGLVLLLLRVCIVCYTYTHIFYMYTFITKPYQKQLSLRFHTIAIILTLFLYGSICVIFTPYMYLCLCMYAFMCMYR